MAAPPGHQPNRMGRLMAMRNLVVIGRHGQLAQELAGLGWPEGWQVHYLGRHDIDLADAAGSLARIAALRPTLLLNAAAYAGVDLAESDQAAATFLNATLPAILAAHAAALDIPLLHVSTDYVFNGGTQTPYAEATTPVPLSVYGNSKRAGEIAVMESAARTLTVRSAWLFGRHGHNFLKTIVNRALVAPHAPLRVVDDQIGTPTPAAALAAILRDLAIDLAGGRDLPLLLHVAGNPAISWHGFADRIISAFHAAATLTSAPPVLPIPSREYPPPARRPAYSVLDCTLAESLGFVMPDWRQSLTALAASWPNVRRAA